MRIIPAIDIINGECVRLSKGDYNRKTIYSKNVLDIAKNFEDNGIRFLHLVDLDGARQNQIINYKTLEKISAKTNLIIDFGGGLKSEEDIRIAFENGAKQVTLGSVAVKNPELFLEILKNIDNDIQTRAISKSLAIVQGDLTTLPANMAISSARGTTFFYIKAVFSFESRPNTI